MGQWFVIVLDLSLSHIPISRGSLLTLPPQYTRILLPLQNSATTVSHLGICDTSMTPLLLQSLLLTKSVNTEHKSTFRMKVKPGCTRCSEHCNDSAFHWEINFKVLIIANQVLNDLCHPWVNSTPTNLTFHHLGLLSLEIHCTPFKLSIAACYPGMQIYFWPFLQWFP